MRVMTSSCSSGFIAALLPFKDRGRTILDIPGTRRIHLHLLGKVGGGENEMRGHLDDGTI